MRTLFSRLSLALLSIVTLVGTGFFFVERFSTQTYYEELTQRLNAPIAMYVTGEQQLFVDDLVNRKALETLAQQAMVINPTVEVYLLDGAGKILGHTFPPETLVTGSVDLGPVRELINGGAALPLRGTDPRNSDRHKVFSAAEVRAPDGRLQGYLYVVLGGQKYDELADDIRSSYTQRTSVWALLVIVVTGFLIGLLVLGLLTRRLTRLNRDVQQYTASGFDPHTKVAARKRPALAVLRGQHARLGSVARDRARQGV